MAVYYKIPKKSKKDQDFFEILPWPSCISAELKIMPFRSGVIKNALYQKKILKYHFHFSILSHLTSKWGN